ncbi:MAG TPA: polyprenol phosphomannose-dependent alpha 1,6 mannosyltransferase MptB, partial [Mycobacteriales bacterium]|nr:polyprenol phosphomannose-dependent alpha 1,6 mannosyltransferase MptB [Mycobacteriales bacterium]
GLAVLALAWLYLGRAVRRGADGTSAADLLRTALLWAAPLLVAAPLFSRDMYSYAAQAQLTHLGLDPYSNGPAAVPGPFLDEVQRMWVDTPAPYGPLWLVLGSLVAGVTGHHVLLTVLAMRMLAVAGTVLIAWFLPRLAAHFGTDPRTALWLAVLNPLLLVHFVAGGHNDALMLGLVMAGLWIVVSAVTEARLAVGVAVITLAVLIKAPAALAVAFAVPIWASRLDGPHPRSRAAARVAVVGLGTFAAVTLASGLGIGWIRQLNTPGAVANVLSVPTGLAMLVNGVRHVLGLAGDSQAMIDLFRTVGKVVSAVAVLAIWAGSFRGRSFRGQPVRLLAVALAVVVVLSPVVQPWYLLWALVVAAATPLPERARMVAAGLSVFLSLLITPQGATLFNMAWPMLTTGFAVAVATHVALARDREGDPRPARLNATAEHR